MEVLRGRCIEIDISLSQQYLCPQTLTLDIPSNQNRTRDYSSNKIQGAVCG
ncbi:1297_t:CDS:1, partial [Acaulospora morrowiae]